MSPPVPRVTVSVIVWVSVELPASVDVGVRVEEPERVSVVVTPPAVAVRVEVWDCVTLSTAERLCESVLASEALSEAPPELTMPSVPSTWEPVATDEPAPLPVIVSVELSVAEPVNVAVVVVPARLDEAVPEDEAVRLPTRRRLWVSVEVSERLSAPPPPLIAPALLVRLLVAVWVPVSVMVCAPVSVVVGVAVKDSVPVTPPSESDSVTESVADSVVVRPRVSVAVATAERVWVSVPLVQTAADPRVSVSQSVAGSQ
jgi:hypothetical protein